MLKLTVFALLLITHSFVSSEYIFQGYNDEFKPEWWQSNIIYQIYVRSFKDTNGDGIGDLNGVVEKIPYLKSLFVGAVWLSPIFKSPMDDFGYDISNYKEIDPVFGSMADFDRLRNSLHENGIKLILDFVPNHTSDEHPWFIKSVKKQEPYTDYYIWKDAVIDKEGNRQPPNNWLSVFNSGSAWKWNEERQQYYYHAFQVKQPDLNYRSPMVVEEIKNTILYWLGRGVDGFRFDAVNFLYEKENLEDEPKSLSPDARETDWSYLVHTSTLDQPETFKMVQTWRKLLDEFSTYEKITNFFTVECYSPLDQTMKYYGTKMSPGAHFPFNFLLITNFNRQSDANDINNIVKSWITNMPEGSWANWVVGNHDNHRVATRINPVLVDGVHMLQTLLPGTPITYNGDELGIQNTDIRYDQTVDPAGLNVGPSRYTQFSRDPERSPFPWDDSEHAGITRIFSFTNGTSTWLPINPTYYEENMVDLSKNKSHLRTYRQLARLRQIPTIVKGDLHVYVLSKWVFGFSRSYYDHPTFFVVINLGSELEIVNVKAVRPTLPKIMKVKISSVNSGYVTGNLISTTYFKLRPKAALVLSTSRKDEDSPAID